MTESKLSKTVGDISTLEDLAKSDEYLSIVNQQPPKDHVHDHPIASGVKFIPIGVVETMLTKLFRHWNVEVLREGQLLNSVYVTVRLNYLHPITKKWEHHDGVGAVAVQVDKDRSAADLGAIKANAIMLALPAAKSFAIKDAAEHIGKAFGRDINRKETLAFKASNSSEEQRELINKQLSMLGVSLEEQDGYLIERFGIEIPLTAEGAAFVIKELKDELKQTPNRTN